MKKAVIATGGKQYVVSEGDILEVELLEVKKSHAFDALLVIDGKDTKVGKPAVDGVKVNAEVLEQAVKTDKVTSIRFEAKKRVNKKRGHRQIKTIVKITSIK